ncbi:MAG: aminopeptidase N [Gammaproteobacteria bacterium]|nr:aminopeptidase N [Gammaproteobacteria bacterium]
MKTDIAIKKLLAEYSPPDFSITKTDLFFTLKASQTIVKSRLQILRNIKDISTPLILDGVDLTIQSLSIDDVALETDQYQYDNKVLTIKTPASEFVLESEVVISPETNTSFEGLYISSGNFCTQCEAEGFRHITFYLDRPDVMSLFTTTITAEKSLYPVMLSNGHRTQYAEDDDFHTAVWNDPYPKPAYLFALVAGDLACVKGDYTTRSGRLVGLEFYTEEHNKNYCDHAITSLQQAMAWDEQKFDLEYDLDLYMVVAVDDFNMGAMENKGLNVFNTKYVLASQQTATDQDYLNIEGVIGHEYFHNWTGNRVTCRDWFQLSLKEGLTVYRDQEFSSDLNSRGIQRISDVGVLRTHQFAEDASPMAHPVRPFEYQQINNFYTATVYNKGAEVVRMYDCIIGKQNFKKGIDLYFQRFDGQAVTTDDFRQVMQDVSGINLDQFQRWYEQSGTPIVEVKRQYDIQTKVLTLNFKQYPGATKDVENKAFHIPVRCGLLSKDGSARSFDNGEDNAILNLIEIEQSFTFNDCDSDDIVSLFRGFSAPVKVINDLTNEEKIILMNHDNDDFNRWDASQQIACDIIVDLIETGESAFMDAYIHSIQKLLDNEDLDPALCAELLQLPSEKYIAELVDEIDPYAIHQARALLKHQLATQLTDSFINRYQQTKSESDFFEISPSAMGLRALNNACLNYIVDGDNQQYFELCRTHFKQATNMTDRMGSLNAIKDFSHAIKDELFADFYSNFEEDNLVVDKWFSLQAVAVTEQGLELVKQLLEHPAFTLSNPNRARSLVSTFAHSGSIVFHQKDGSGYQLVAQQLLKLDALNPQVGARLASAFLHWKKMVEPFKSQMKETIEVVLENDSLSVDVREILQSSIPL